MKALAIKSQIFYIKTYNNKFKLRRFEMTQLRGKKALVTGGAMGIGLATCKRLVEEGCDVTIWDMNEEAMADAKKEIEALGGKVFAYKCDVTVKKRVSELVEQAKKDMGQVDILINNAGYVRSGRFCDYPVETWERETDVNLTSMYYTIHAFLPGMYERNSGHIVNISSAAGLVGVPDLAVYSATKWAVWGLTESLRLEAWVDRKFGVKFSSIHPHFLKYGMFEGGKLNFIGNLLVPRVESHDVIAKDIVEKALKKNRHVVKHPKTLHLSLINRALLPDSVLDVILLIIGQGKGMKKWVGRPGSEHAAK
jgi:all-trans-retinol dehydrogenase (NAD+)